MEPPIMLALKMIINEEFEKNYLNANNIQQLIDFSINNGVLGVISRYLASFKLTPKQIKKCTLVKLFNYLNNVNQYTLLKHIGENIIPTTKIVPIKGFDFSMSLYKNMTDRYSGDLDILVDFDDIFTVATLLEKNGYKCLGKNKEPYYKYTENKNMFNESIKYSVDRFHDPITFIPSENSLNNICIEVHTNDYFPGGINIRKIYNSATLIYSGINLPFLNRIDIIVIAAWHFYHHFKEQTPDEDGVTIRHSHIKSFADLYRAVCISSNLPLQITIRRILETNSLHVVTFSIGMLNELYHLLNKTVPQYICNLYYALNDLYSLEHKTNYRQQKLWGQYGNYRINCWEWILNTDYHMSEIQKQIDIYRNNHSSRCVYQAKHYTNENDIVYMDTEEKDRLDSYIYMLYGTENPPTLSWRMNYCDVGLNIELFATSEHDFNLELLFSDSKENRIKDCYTINLKLVDENTTFYDESFVGISIRIGTWKSEKLGVYKYKISGHIDFSDLPFCINSKKFIFRIRYGYLSLRHDKIVLVWPFGIAKYGEVLLI